jgi:hypothetical protein
MAANPTALMWTLLEKTWRRVEGHNTVVGLRSLSAGRHQYHREGRRERSNT